MGRQSLALSRASVFALHTRALSSLIAILGFAGVSSVLLVILSGRQAISVMYALTGWDDLGIITANNASYEGASLIPLPVVFAIERMPGIAHSSGGMAISKELVRPGSVRFLVGDDGRVGPTVTGRGVTRMAFEIRPRLRVVEGRNFRTGLFEVIIGRRLARHFGIRLGSEVRVRTATLKVVGIFESGGDATEMEVWLDKGVLESLLSQSKSSDGAPAVEQISVLWVKLSGSSGLEQLNHAIATSTLGLMKAFNIHAQSEREFLRAQGGDLLEHASKAAIAVGFVMGIGALFGAMNTMYGVVAQRSREIATLRAIGFQAFSIAISVVNEALLLSLIGGLAGTALALLATNDLVFTIYNSDAGMNLVLQFLPSARLSFIALGYVLALGAISSILPCVRALRCPIPAGLFAR